MQRCISFTFKTRSEGGAGVAPDKAIHERGGMSRKVIARRSGGTHAGHNESAKLCHALRQTVGNRALQRLITQLGSENRLASGADAAAYVNAASREPRSLLIQPAVIQRLAENAVLRQKKEENDPAKALASAMKEEQKGEQGISTREANLKSTATLSSDGKFKLDLGPALDLSLFGLKLGARYSADKVKDWKGFVELRLGDQLQGVTGELVIDEKNNLTFNLGHKFAVDMFTVSFKFMTSEEKTGLSESVKWKDAFGVKDLDISAALNFATNDPFFKPEMGLEYGTRVDTPWMPPMLKIGAKISYGVGSRASDTAMVLIYLKFTEAGAGKK
jgi:hypothetical protein